MTTASRELEANWVVRCPECGKTFELRYFCNPHTLEVWACESAGVYDVSVTCPFCKHSESLEVR